jgi:hypothetical protein
VRAPPSLLLIFSLSHFLFLDFPVRHIGGDTVTPSENRSSRRHQTALAGKPNHLFNASA